MEASYLMTILEYRTALHSLTVTVESQARELAEHRRVKHLDDETIEGLSKELQRLKECNRLVVDKLLQRELENSDCREQLWTMTQQDARPKSLLFLMNPFNKLSIGDGNSLSPATSGPLREQLRSLLYERAELESTVEDQRELIQQLQKDYVECKEQAVLLKDRVAALLFDLNVSARAATLAEGFSQMMQSQIMSLLNGFEDTRSHLFQELRSHLQHGAGHRYQLPSQPFAPPVLLPHVPSTALPLSPTDCFDYDEFDCSSIEKFEHDLHLIGFSIRAELVSVWQ